METVNFVCISEIHIYEQQFGDCKTVIIIHPKLFNWVKL